MKRVAKWIRLKWIAHWYPECMDCVECAGTGWVHYGRIHGVKCNQCDGTGVRNVR